MKCEHNDCFTCPYEDCISNFEIGKRSRPGRKELSPEEKAKRRKAYNKAYNQRHQAQNHERYIKKTEGIVKRRYNTRITKMIKMEGT